MGNLDRPEFIDAANAALSDEILGSVTKAFANLSPEYQDHLRQDYAEILYRKYCMAN